MDVRRARDAGMKGMYAPRMVVHHVIPSDRLRKRYFRRWFYWHGVSRAMLYQQRPIDMGAPEETNINFSKSSPAFRHPSLHVSVVPSLGNGLDQNGSEWSEDCLL